MNVVPEKDSALALSGRDSHERRERRPEEASSAPNDPGSDRDSATRAREQRLVAIGEIAAEVAHELRNALQIVSANVYLARQNLAASEPHLAKIERSARLAHGIVDDLMALARGEPTHAEPVLVSDLLLASRETLAEPGAEFEDAIQPPSLLVRAHVGLASRLLHALYENSIKAAAPRRVHITTRAERIVGTESEKSGARVALVIGDDGPGVPAEIAETLFEPLVTRSVGGTGLGLALARRIVDAHGGTIAHVPTASGATFRIELPAP